MATKPAPKKGKSITTRPPKPTPTPPSPKPVPPSPLPPKNPQALAKGGMVKGKKKAC